MGFLDNLLKKGAADALRGLMGSGGAANPAAAPQQQSAPQQQQAVPQQSAPQEPSPSGWSWGETMPAEENQYNFNGTYDQYFDSVLRGAFPEYEITMESADRQHGQYASARPAKIVTFRKNGQTALIIELMSQHSTRRKLRRDCRSAGIPYLRFYYDYHGWWNTKSYVTERTRRALEG
ncbi:MAG: hypothetical protein IJ060_00765 [Oscillospiraceae bacterium]|nr:hypothetical protein [Oscillospiraceae bacterium]